MAVRGLTGGPHASGSAIAATDIPRGLVANVTGGAPENGTIRGSLRFTSSKHGTVNIPVEDFFVETP